MVIGSLPTVIQYAKTGQANVVAIGSKERVAQLPDVPTIDEAGVKGYDMGYWFAAYAPAGTPAPVVARLNELLGAATQSAGAKTFFDNAGSEAWRTSPDELAKFQAAETVKWGKVIKAAGIEPE